MSRAALRSRAGRIGMACYAVWIALALASQGATPCPTHDPRIAAAFAGATMPVSMAGIAHDAASPSPHRVSDHDSQGDAHHPANHHAHHHACTCVGCGCCVALMDLCAPARTIVPAPAAVARVAALPVTSRAPVAANTDRRLPFANGPPSEARVPV